ncbi:hypothetical protein CRYUN_Cryun15aG0072800 [Craigia yunnanensis]
MENRDLIEFGYYPFVSVYIIKFPGCFPFGWPMHDDGKVMMEYIGATGVPVKFDPVPIEDGIDFHFILSFAIDADPSGNAQNGKFSPYWADTLSLESVAAIKKNHPNVKALASFSGWSLEDKVNSSITLLKNQSVISIATIAPFHTTTIPYIELFENYGDVIDFVNYQFYTDKVGKPKGYLEAFKLRAGQFDKDKLLPSYEINGRGIQGDSFFDALSLLEENGFTVNGVMNFSADASSSNDYYYERKSQDFLLNLISKSPVS